MSDRREAFAFPVVKAADAALRDAGWLVRVILAPASLSELLQEKNLHRACSAFISRITYQPDSRFSFGSIKMAEPPTKRAKRTDSATMWERDDEPRKRQSNGTHDRRDRRDDGDRKVGRDSERKRSRSKDRRRDRSWSREKKSSGRDNGSTKELDSRRRDERRGGLNRDRDRRDRERDRDRDRDRSRETNRPRKGNIPILYISSNGRKRG